MARACALRAWLQRGLRVEEIHDRAQAAAVRVSDDAQGFLGLRGSLVCHSDPLKGARGLGVGLSDFEEDLTFHLPVQRLDLLPPLKKGARGILESDFR
jgi:hypothetical protein